MSCCELLGVGGWVWGSDHIPTVSSCFAQLEGQVGGWVGGWMWVACEWLQVGVGLCRWGGWVGWRGPIIHH